MSARVLVVDDIAANVRLLEAKLAAEYFEVMTASSGKEALALIEKQTPDIVLLDVMMPELDGFEVCKRIRANPRTRFLPVVMVTALSDQADRVRGLEAGADDFLTKPVSDVALIARVRSLSRLKLMTDELRMRAVTSRDIGIESPEREAIADTGIGGRVLVVIGPTKRRRDGVGDMPMRADGPGLPIGRHLSLHPRPCNTQRGDERSPDEPADERVTEHDRHERQRVEGKSQRLGADPHGRRARPRRHRDRP